VVVSATEGSWGRHHHLAAFLHDRGGQGSGKLGRWGRRRLVLGPGRRRWRRLGWRFDMAADPDRRVRRSGSVSHYNPNRPCRVHLAKPPDPRLDLIPPRTMLSFIIYDWQEHRPSWNRSAGGWSGGTVGLQTPNGGGRNAPLWQRPQDKRKPPITPDRTDRRCSRRGCRLIKLLYHQSVVSIYCLSLLVKTMDFSPKLLVYGLP
jgi:hypothetical protein